MPKTSFLSISEATLQPMSYSKTSSDRFLEIGLASSALDGVISRRRDSSELELLSFFSSERVVARELWCWNSSICSFDKRSQMRIETLFRMLMILRTSNQSSKSSVARAWSLPFLSFLQKYLKLQLRLFRKDLLDVPKRLTSLTMLLTSSGCNSQLSISFEYNFFQSAFAPLRFFVGLVWMPSRSEE